MTSVLDLPDELLTIVVKHMRDVPSGRRRRFLDSVAYHIDLDNPSVGDARQHDPQSAGAMLRVEVFSACHMARYFMEQAA
jgi:hypothetical protein